MTAPAVADPWMNLHDAAAYCGFKHTGLRSCINRGELPPDGRGPRNIAMFRRSSLDRFLEDRARRMLPPESASGDRTTDGEISRRDADRYPLVLALATTGARFGEVTALQWTDIDESAGTIRIARAQWNGTIDTTKTGAARTVPLAPELAVELRAHYERMRPRIEGPLPAWVFPTEVWTLPRNTVLRKPLAKAATRAKLGFVPSNHWFRHTFNDLLRQTVSGQVTRAITGHVEESMTEHYSHVSFEEKREAVGRVLYLVGGGRGGGDADGKRKAG